MKYLYIIMITLFLLLFTIYILSIVIAENINEENELVEMDRKLVELYIDDNTEDEVKINGTIYNLIKDYDSYSKDIKVYNNINKLLPPFLYEDESKPINKDKTELDKKFKNISQKTEDEYNENITRYL